MSQGTVGNIEAGIRDGAQSLASIALALGIRYEWLRDGDGEMDATSDPWPFETVDRGRFDRLSERQKGRIEQAIADAIKAIETEPGKRSGTA